MKAFREIISVFRSSASLLREAIIQSDLTRVKKIIEMNENLLNTDISSGDPFKGHHGYAPIHYVCEYNTKIDILEYLISQNANLDLKTANEDDRSTPLHVAVKFCKMEMLEILLRNNAKPEEKDQLGETVLMKAASKGDTSACVQLLLNGALFNNRDFLGQTPLMLAMKNNQADTFDYLLNHRDNRINEKDNNGNTILMRSIQQKQVEYFTRILKHPEVNLNEQNNKEETALMLAISSKQIDMITGFFACSAASIDFSLRNKDKLTAWDMLQKTRSSFDPSEYSAIAVHFPENRPA